MPSRCYYDRHFSDIRTAGNSEVFVARRADNGTTFEKAHNISTNTSIPSGTGA